MLAKRIIPCLGVTNGRVVRGVNFVELRDADDPVEIVRRYDKQDADEITFLNITAMSDGRDLMLDIVEAVASQMFIPLTVGGGVRVLEDVRRLPNAGADKINMNSSVVTNPQLVSDASARHGARYIVVAIDAKEVSAGDETPRWKAFTHDGRKNMGLNAMAWTREMAQRNAGEIPLTSMDRDGTKTGFDLELTHAVSDTVPVPVIASGDVGNPQHLADGIQRGRADVMLAVNVFHYGEYTVGQARQFMVEQAIPVRVGP